MRVTEITCDFCQRDLSTTDNCEGYRIALVQESKTIKGPFVTMMAIPAPLPNGPHHFCSTDHLREWLKAKNPQGAETI